MRTISIFQNVSLDGYFTDANNDMSWAHEVEQTPDWTSFTEQNAKGGGMLVFGRVTYDLMRSYWPTPQAANDAPEVAQQMNSLPKVVFSRTMADATWTNTTLIKGDPAAAIRQMKTEDGDNMVMMGSGTIIPLLTDAGLVDEFQVIVVPVVLGGGRTMFDGVSGRPRLKLTATRNFDNGNVMLTYVPARIPAQA